MKRGKKLIDFSPISINTHIDFWDTHNNESTIQNMAVSKFKFGLYKPNLHAYIRSPQSTKKYYRTGRKKLWGLFMMKGWADNNFEK